MIPDDAWPAGDLLEWGDDETRTFHDFLNETTRPYTDAENAEADERDAERTAQSNAETLTERVRAALAGNADFLALTSPTNAQTLAQVRALTRQQSALARLAIGELSDAN